MKMRTLPTLLWNGGCLGKGRLGRVLALVVYQKVGGVVGETIMFHFHWEIYIVSHDTIDFADFVGKKCRS